MNCNKLGNYIISIHKSLKTLLKFSEGSEETDWKGEDWLYISVLKLVLISPCQFKWSDNDNVVKLEDIFPVLVGAVLNLSLW